MDRIRSSSIVFALACLLVACGGGGGGGGVADEDDAIGGGPAPVPADVSGAAEASRFLSQAAFGGTMDEINAVVARGDYAAWIDAQIATPPTTMVAAFDDLEASFDPGDRTKAELDAAGVPYFEEEGEVELEGIIDGIFMARATWWTMLMRAQDPLRQRVAYALSQLLVVSDRTDATSDALVMVGYYDTLIRNALGNYRTLLEEITYDTGMGLYLTHMGNDKGDPAAGIFPDENYARELMQLFTIGLWELNQDGTRKLDASGAPIPTYTNADITELAKVMTGLGPNEGMVFQATELVDHDFGAPMAVWEQHHATGPKRLIDGTTTNGTTAQDIDAALDALMRHANTAPFVSKFLIQRLVTANPTPAYVRRVADVFVDNGRGVRGDLAAVVRAILLDAEARDPSQRTDRSGKLREPALRYVQMMKAFDVQSPSGLLLTLGAKLQDKNDVADEIEPAQLGQHPLSAPSVFNFYRPDFQPRELVGTGLVSPEAQIVNATTVSGYNNLLRQALFERRPMDSMIGEELLEEFPNHNLERHLPVMRDFARYGQLAGDPTALVQSLDILLAGGGLSDTEKNAVVRVLSDARATAMGALDRVRLATYLVMLSPGYLYRS